MRKTVLTFAFVFLCSQGFCEDIENRVIAVEEAIDDLRFQPRTTQDDMVRALDQSWPTVPTTLNKLLEQGEKARTTIDKLSVKADFFMEQLKTVSERSTENERVNYRQDIDINSLRKEQSDISGRQDKIEGTWAGIVKGSTITVAGCLVSGFFSILFLIVRAGLIRKIFGNKVLSKKAKEEVVK